MTHRWFAPAGGTAPIRCSSTMRRRACHVLVLGATAARCTDDLGPLVPDLSKDERASHTPPQ